MIFGGRVTEWLARSGQQKGWLIGITESGVSL